MERNRMCARCRNHKIKSVFKGHKQICPFTKCPCGKCSLVKERQRIIAQQKRKNYEKRKLENVYLCTLKLEKQEKLERKPICARCKCHGFHNKLKGHKRFCPFKYCDCWDCNLLVQRQKVVAKQVALWREQHQDDAIIQEQHQDDELGMSANHHLYWMEIPLNLSTRVSTSTAI